MFFCTLHVFFFPRLRLYASVAVLTAVLFEFPL